MIPAHEEPTPAERAAFESRRSNFLTAARLYAENPGDGSAVIALADAWAACLADDLNALDVEVKVYAKGDRKC